jgi:hypothetical protein
MTAALATNPLGALVVAAGVAVAALASLGDETFQFGDTAATGFQAAAAAFQTVKEIVVEFYQIAKESFLGTIGLISELVDTTLGDFGDWGSGIEDILGMIGGFFASAVNLYIGYNVGAIKVIKDVWSAIPLFFELIVKKAANVVATGVENMVNFFTAGLIGIAEGVDTFTGSNYGEELSKSLTLDLEQFDLSGLQTEADAAAKGITTTFKEALNFDYLGAAVSKFKSNLGEIVEADKQAADAADLLNEVYGERVNALSEVDDATKKALKGLEAYKSGLQEEFDAVREANGGATKVTEEWYAAQLVLLKKAGLENTKYAEMLEVIYSDRLVKARLADVESTFAWAAGLSAAQRQVAEGFRTEFQEIQAIQGDSTSATYQWYEEQKAILAAAGLEGPKYAEMIESAFSVRLAEARRSDIENANSWAAGLTAAQQVMVSGVAQEWERYSEAHGGAVAAVQTWYDTQKALLAAAGLDHSMYADQLDEIFGVRIAQARMDDIDSATDWASGIKKAVANMSQGFSTEADLMENVFGRAFNGMSDALGEFVKTGKLDFGDLTRSIIGDIMQMVLKFLLLKAVKAALGIPMAEGGLVGFASGGRVTGPGTGTSDSIPARLSNGEFVINAKSTRDNLPLLQSINSGSFDMLKMAEGGLAGTKPVMPMRSPQQQAPQQATVAPASVRVMNFLDPKESLAALDTAEGEQVVFNMIERNPDALRKILGVS